MNNFLCKFITLILYVKKKNEIYQVYRIGAITYIYMKL